MDSIPVLIIRLKEFLLQQSGEQLWGLVYYAADERSVLHLRDELTEQSLLTQTTHLLGHEEQETNPPRGFEDRQASLTYYRHSVVLQLPVAEDSGVIAVFDIAVASDSYGFIQECKAVLNGER